jgi:hypothetical protein
MNTQKKTGCPHNALMMEHLKTQRGYNKLCHII